MKIPKLYVYTDFDGTITQKDLLYHLLDVAAPPEWRKIEDALTEEKIDEQTALRQEFALLNISLEDAIPIILDVPIDPHFKAFALFCRDHHIPLEILSGGFDQFIQAYLHKYGLDFIPFHSNSARVVNNRWEIIGSPNPKIRNQCNHCKTYWLQQKIQKGYTIVYIGDGNTDRCPATHAHFRFAKKELAVYLKKHGVPYIPYETFADVLPAFQELLIQVKENHRVTPFFNTPH